MEKIYEEYLLLQEEIKEKRMRLEELQQFLYEAHEINFVNDSAYEAVCNNIKFVCKENKKLVINQDAAAKANSTAIKVEYKLDKREFNKLPIEERNSLNECLEYKTGKPIFKVERINDGN
jgi:hypothetical protein